MSWSFAQLCLLHALMAGAYPPYPSYAQSEALRGQYAQEAEQLLTKCETYDHGAVALAQMTEQLEGDIEAHLAALTLCRQALEDGQSTPTQWAQACDDVSIAPQDHAQLAHSLQAHIARMDAILPTTDVQRQKLRQGEAGVAERLMRLQNVIASRRAIQATVRHAVDGMAWHAPEPVHGQPGWVAQSVALRQRAQLFRDEAVYLLDVADAPILARRAIVSARAAVSALPGPENLPSDLTQTIWPHVERSLAEDFAVTQAIAARIDSVWAHELDAYAERRQGRAQGLVPAASTGPVAWDAAWTALEDLGAESSAAHESAFVTLWRLSRGGVP